MRYISTRGSAPVLSFEEAMLTGLARDGGLYVPETIPTLSADQITAMQGQSYEEVAFTVMRPFIGDTFTDAEFKEIIAKAYAGFKHDARAPLVQLGPNHFLLELFHGPTLAFKDFAMQLIGQLFQAALSRSGKRVTIVGATSGDTGSAAIEAFKGLSNVDVFILFPHGRVSDVQRRQMTTPPEANVHALAVEGDFDDCQAALKEMFADIEFRDHVKLAAVNSINWARIAAQAVYYATAQAALGAGRPLRFVVPSGNMGDVLAGYVAARCGLLSGFEAVCAVNENDALRVLLQDGRMSRASAVSTPSPAMDISIPSNFERLAFEASGRDAETIRRIYGQFAQSGEVVLPQTVTGPMSCMGLKAARVSNETTLSEINRMHAETGWLVCPHTAVGTNVARGLPESDAATIVLATAHAAKFPETITAATGQQAALPARVQAVASRSEVFEDLVSDVSAVRDYIQLRQRT